MSKVNFKKLALEGVAFQGGVSLLSFAWVLLLARNCGAAELGMIIVCLSVANSITMLSGIGIQHSMVIKSSSHGDEYIVSNGFSTILLLAFIASAFGFIVARMTSFEAMSGLDSSFAAAVTGFIFINVYSNSLLRTLHRFRTANLLSVILPLLFILSITLLIVFDSGSKVSAILLAYAVSVFVSMLITVRFVLANGLYQRSTVSVRHVIAMIGVGGHVQVGNVLKEAMYKADLYVVTWLLGSTAAGLYSVVLKIVEGFGRFVDAVGLVTLPLVAKYSNNQRNELTASLILILFPASLLLAFFVSFMHESIVMLLFGEGYRPSSELLRMGIYALPFISIWKILANDFIGRGLINQYVLSSGAGASIVIFANYLFLPHYGLSVAPIVLVSAYALAFIVSFVSAKLILDLRFAKISFVRRKLLRKLDE